MTATRTIPIALLMTLLVWVGFSWPLPRHACSGIPSSSTNVEQGNVRRMIMGDHLQLLYHYWLSADSMLGQTPPFSNPYEFNDGSDDVRRYIGFDNAFFAGFFTVGYLLGGRAVGWNLMGFVSLFLTYIFTWLLLRVYTRRRGVAPILALVAIALPYRWHMLLGGSPSGLAMAWTPMLLWGVDAWLRRNSLLGSALAGLAIFFAYWNDMYVFFFCVQLAPCWVALVLLRDKRFPWKALANWRRLILVAWPMLLMLAVVAALALSKHADVAAAEADAGHDSWRDVVMSSPIPAGLVQWRTREYNSLVYIGVLAPILLLCGLGLQILAGIRHPRTRWRETAFLCLLTAGIGGIVILALGARGPFNGGMYIFLREHLSPYALIRQPAKFFTILPPLLALALALAASNVMRRLPRPGVVPRIVLLVTVLLPIFEYKFQIRPMICLLDNEQHAYRAVAEDARLHTDNEPHALILPIWPGNSAWSSLYEHYVSLYRIRMLNGYLPVVPRGYIENVYRHFDSCTSGAISDDQLARLTDMGVRYVILHENAFPEKVSAFPVAFTLKRLLNHPRLDLLRQDQSVWAFRIREIAAARPPRLSHWNRFFPVQHALREFEWYAPEETLIGADTNAAGDRFVRLHAVSNQTVAVPVFVSQVPDLTLQARVAGHGELTVRTLAADFTNTQVVAIDAPGWTWSIVRLPTPDRDAEAALEFRCTVGAVALDMLLTAAGQPLFMAPGEQIALPAPLFFHAGYTDLDRDVVILRMDTEQDGEPLYGPNLPLTPGRYRLRVDVTSDAPAGTPLGRLKLVCGEARYGPFPVTAGKDALAEFTIPRKNLPVRMAFDYTRQADVAIGNFVFERLE